MEDISQEQELNVNPTDQPPGSGVTLSLSDIAALKDRIEQQKANKLKAEQLVSTLSKIKAREKATRRSTKSGEKNEDGPNQPIKRSGTNSSNALKEKSNLLKKKLEEDRAKFESKKGQEDLGKVNEIVEHIRVQLEGQDKTIQQIHSNFAATTKAPQPVEEVEQVQPDIPPEVKQRIADLEMKILDLQENLREKDSVISARTQAITLLSEDMARKGKNTLDNLEETRIQMKAMQANFVALEDRMNEERTRLREEVEAKKLRLQQVEKNYRAAESARFDLSTRVAELQEKVVTLQTRNLSLDEEVAEASTKTKELQEALESSNKQTVKLKAQFKAKLKALEEERDMLRKDERANEELTRLRERIADLEDEKEAGHLLKERISEMEEKLHRQECDLDSHIKALTSLEAEKLDLIEAASKKNALLEEKQVMIQTLQAQLSEVNGTKIAAEMKCLELEEKLDAYIKSEGDSAKWNAELEKANQKLLEYKETINELTMKLESRETALKASGQGDSCEQKELQDMSSLVEWQHKYSVLEDKLNSTLAYCEQLEARKREIENNNAELMNECGQLRNAVDKLNSALNSRSQSSDQQVDELRQMLAQRDIEISNVNKHNKTLETEVDNLRYTLQATTFELHNLSQQVEELSCTKHKMEELNMVLDNKEKELDERSRKLSEYKKFHKLKSEDVLRISHELETVSTSSQQRISELETALSNAQEIEENLRKEIAELKENINKGPESMDTKLQEQSLKMKKIAANLKLKAKLVKDFEAKVEELEKTLQQKDILISSLENEKANLQKQLVENYSGGNGHSVNTAELEEKCRVLETEVNSLKEELNSKMEEIECLKSTSSEKYETVVQIKELENENKKLNDISESKSDQLKKMEDEISDLSGLNKSLLSELEQMQESYKQDALKNESVLDSFEHEMLGNKKDILELSNQLKDVTGKYEQAWVKLQEKEGYIEDLEQQLERVKLRLLQIESTVEDRRRSLEEKAELLGARLNQAEMNNEQLERHEGELEQKIAFLLNTEEMLGNVLEKLQEENAEMTKSLSESADKNIQLAQELECERGKVQSFTKEMTDLRTNLANYEKISEEYETVKAQLKELQEVRDSQVRYLENRLTESEQCMDSEIRRLLDKVNVVEAERQEVLEKFNSLLMEKQMLEEEMTCLQQTIADIRREELEELRSNHDKLEEQLNKELEKRREYICRIQELESQLKQNLGTELPVKSQEQEVLELKEQLHKECKEKETLQYELLKEKAKKQIDDVVCKAEETFFTMSSPSDNTEIKSAKSISFESVPTASSADLFPTQELPKNKPAQVSQISELENKLSALSSENAKLKSRLQELESRGQNASEASGGQPENDDWTAVSKDDDDGWGWGSKDAMLEHEYIQKQKVSFELEAKVVELENKLINANEENKKLNEELKSAQTKCSKLFKKLKEFKSKSDSLERNSREKSVGFDDLDLAMQEELRSQVERLEKNLKECNANLNLLQQEKEGFLNRIDVLTSGNERLIEMKERQDIEVEMWQRRSNELQNKVQGLEWTIAELHAEQNDSKDVQGNGSFSSEEKQQFLSNALEMEEKLNVLAAENDYLQSLIVELKDKDKNTASSHLFPVKDENKNQQDIDNNKYLQLQQENVRLNDVVQTLEEKLKLESKNTNENVIEYTHRIESLMKENEWLSSSIEKLKAKSDSEFHMHDEFQALNDRCSVLKSENEFLSSSVSELNRQLAELQAKFEFIETEKNNYEGIFNHLEGRKENINVQDGAVTSQASDATESPTLFRGFTSCSEDAFNVNSNSGTSIFDSKTIEKPAATDSLTHPSTDFFDSIKLETGFASPCEKEPQNINTVSNLGPENREALETLKSEEYLVEINKVKTILTSRESEIISLRETLTALEEENNTLRRTIEDKTYLNSVAWTPLTSVPSEESSGDRSLHWGEELNLLRKQVEDKDCTISSLTEKLNQKTDSLFGDEKTPSPEPSTIGNYNFNDLFSRSENDHESQINYFVEQITELTKKLHDKEIEIQTLSDKKTKYKEMYHGIAKEYSIHSSDLSNTDKDHLADQNVMLNQLLDDKETELEMMSQQIDQSIVAKANLQDEITLMEAAKNSFAISEILLPQSQPENIEDVRSLCAEIAELTKLLQEKESEVEIVKQQIDESNLEKENLIDEWKKELDIYKEKANNEAEKVRKLEEELDGFKDDLVKQYKDELYQKDQQLMNALNDLRNTHSFCQDSQTKMEALERNLQNCTAQNNLLLKELNGIQNIHSDLQAVVGNTEDGTEPATLIEKVLKLKDSLKELEVKLEQARIDIEERDKIIFDLRERVKFSEANVRRDDKVITEQPISPMQAKTFASEPFRISTEQSSSDDDSSSKHTESIQAQMLMKEIQSLKQVLSMKDTEITRLSIALNDAQENLIRGEMRFINSEEESLRQRLDEALYTLHLRDVRCDELALELMQLLEERDSLQLRLSTAIRFNEELRQKSKLLDEATITMEGETSNSSEKLDDNGSDEQLKQKLDQLHNVGYRRDPGLQQDQHRRHQEQMQLYSPHAAQDDSQSSLGFFNWIFGASSSGPQDV